MKPDTSNEKKTEFSESITDRTDEWLLREWKSGDERAAEVLFNRYAIRLVALVASRLNRRYQAAIDPNEIVQSAMGSFFDAAKHSRIQVSGSVSLWRLLATFARRKMTRSIERHSAAKRGGDYTRVSLETVQPKLSDQFDHDTDEEADQFIAALKAELPDDLFVIVEGLLMGKTQRELAESLGIDERTVRRRLARIRDQLAPVVDEATSPRSSSAPEGLVASSTTTLPRVSYRKFVLGKLIGSGGFGKVYRARMQSDGHTVAVKFLRKAFWQNEIARQTFIREINIASQISHSSVIRYLGYGESPHGGPYVISEWIDGQSMLNVAEVKQQRFTRWLIQICEAIQVVHEAGLVHGDLTPANVLVDANDRITITDFGFSQSNSATAPAILDGTQLLGGTLGFAAPEQIDPAFGSISIKTDIYAIGGLVHWFLFRRPPNAAQGLDNTLTQTLSHHDPQQATFGAVPHVFRDILVATLRKSPASRSMDLVGVIRVLRSTTTGT